MSEPTVAHTAPARSRRAAKLLLALTALGLCLLVLEVGARLMFRTAAPVRLRDGIYVSMLPLVNGRPSGRWSGRVKGPRLPRAKAAGEIRIFTFGESSMVGAPWGYAAAPATMLRDLLVTALPDRHVTVVNMGKTSSFMMDSWYYLTAIEPFQPDFIVFYQGANDSFDLDPEMCYPATHPRAYAVWRALVDHSRLLWLVRVMGPESLGVLHSQAAVDAQPRSLCSDDVFGVWADLLMAKAKAMGAQVIVTRPVQSSLHDAEYEQVRATQGLAPPQALAHAGAAYRRALAAALQAGRPFEARHVEVEQGEDFFRLYQKGESWRDTAKRHGAPFIDFWRLLSAHSPGGVLGPPLIVDEVHLSLQGYGLLAAAWATEIRALVQGQAASRSAPIAPPSTARYERDIRGEAGIRLAHGLQYIQSRRFLMAAAVLSASASADPTGPAAVVLAWLRLRLGLPSGLGAAHAALVAHLDLAGLAKATVGAQAAAVDWWTVPGTAPR